MSLLRSILVGICDIIYSSIVDLTLEHRKHGEVMASTCHQSFYYGERRGKLCLTVFDKLIDLSPGQEIRAYFSLSATNMLFYM